MTRNEELAWAAGMIDGEGCISLARRNPQAHNRAISPNYRLLLKVSMCHEPTIKRLHQIFGGKGTVHGQTVSKDHYSAAWGWLCNATDAGEIIREIRPWLFTKADEADVALEFLDYQATVKTRGGKGGSSPMAEQVLATKDWYYTRLRLLKTRNASKDRLKELNETEIQKRQLQG